MKYFVNHVNMAYICFNNLRRILWQQDGSCVWKLDEKYMYGPWAGGGETLSKQTQDVSNIKPSFGQRLKGDAGLVLLDWEHWPSPSKGIPFVLLTTSWS